MYQQASIFLNSCHRTLLVTFIMLWCTSILPAQSAIIATDGKALAVIVVAQNAPITEQTAATELASFLKQVTGAKFELVEHRKPGMCNLLVGREAATAADPKLNLDDLGTDGILIRTVGDDLILTGAAPRGTLYAVYTFLEDQLSCRWWTPSVSTILHQPNIKIDSLNIRYKPILEARETDAFASMEGDWSVRNKYNGAYHAIRPDQGGRFTREPGFVHTFFNLIEPAKYFDQHPDWFTQLNGKRSAVSPVHSQSSLCLSNVEMRKQLVANLKEMLRDAPAEASSCGLSEVRFCLPGGKTFVGNLGPGKGWDTSRAIKMTASSQHLTRVALKAIDGSGLDPQTGLLHGIDPDGTMFMTSTRRESAKASSRPGAVPGEHWVAFEFDKVYPIGQMWIWNQNENHYHVMGMRKVTIRCSATGGANASEWKTMFEGEIPEAAGTPNQPYQLAVDFAGAEAKYVVITSHNSWASSGQDFIAEVSQPDDAGPPEHCECDTCRKIETEEGSASGPLIRFINAVAADMHDEYPNVPISTLAYHYTQKPPAHTKPDPNVIVRLCDIHASFSVPLSDDRNKEFRDDLVEWSKISQRLYIWDYTANFSYSICPHPNLRVLGPNIRFLVAHGARGYFAEALMNSPGLENAELRSWVLSKLMWNPDQDGEKLIAEFVNGFYGPAGKHVLAYINLMHDAVEKSGDYLGLSSPPDAKFLTLENLCKGWDHLRQAEKAAANDRAIRQRVQIAQLPVMYVFLFRFDELHKQATDAKRPWPMPATAKELYERIKSVAAENQINLASVPSPIPF